MEKAGETKDDRMGRMGVEMVKGGVGKARCVVELVMSKEFG